MEESNGILEYWCSHKAVLAGCVLLLSAVEARRIGLLAISHDDALLGRVSHRLATLAG